MPVLGVREVRGSCGTVLGVRKETAGVLFFYQGLFQVPRTGGPKHRFTSCSTSCTPCSVSALLAVMSDLFIPT